MVKVLMEPVLGQAPSKGNFRRGGRNWRTRWGRIKDFEQEIGSIAMTDAEIRRAYATHGEPNTVRTFCYNQRADAGNISKGVLDALEGVLYVNDRVIRDDAVPRKDKGKARVEIEVEWE